MSPSVSLPPENPTYSHSPWHCALNLFPQSRKGCPSFLLFRALAGRGRAASRSLTKSALSGSNLPIETRTTGECNFVWAAFHFFEYRKYLQTCFRKLFSRFPQCSRL